MGSVYALWISNNWWNTAQRPCLCPMNLIPSVVINWLFCWIGFSEIIILLCFGSIVSGYLCYFSSVFILACLDCYGYPCISFWHPKVWCCCVAFIVRVLRFAPRPCQFEITSVSTSCYICVLNFCCDYWSCAATYRQMHKESFYLWGFVVLFYR